MKVKDNAPLILKKNNYHSRNIYPDKPFQFKANINRKAGIVNLPSKYFYS